jgi:type II restriction enzyme
MMERIEKNQAPDFFFMEYVPEEWVVRNLFLIPRFFMNSSIIEKRTPLSRSARRAGWTGCNILFSRLPEDARIAIITDEKGIDPTEVRKKYRALDFLDSRNHLQRGWISDILYFVRRIGKPTFDLAEVYHFEDELKGLHPGNTHIRDKIRQQLQFLRDKGILSFEGKGKYTLLR